MSTQKLQNSTAVNTRIIEHVIRPPAKKPEDIQSPLTVSSERSMHCSFQSVLTCQVSHLYTVSENYTSNITLYHTAKLENLICIGSQKL